MTNEINTQNQSQHAHWFPLAPELAKRSGAYLSERVSDPTKPKSYTGCVTSLLHHLLYHPPPVFGTVHPSIKAGGA